MSRDHMRHCILYSYDNGDSIETCLQQLQRIYGAECPSRNTIVRWYERIASGDRSLQDYPRSGRPELHGCASLIQTTIDEQPSISTRGLSTLTGLSRGTIDRICDEELDLEKRPPLAIPHELSPKMKKDRVNDGRALLSILESRAPEQYGGIVTLDEAQFPLRYPSDFIWTKRGEQRQEEVRSRIHEDKIMVVIVLSADGVLQVTPIPGKDHFNSSVFIHSILEPLQELLRPHYPAHAPQKCYLHMDNSAIHRSAQVTAFLARSIFIPAPQPPYSPDLSPCDFFLFGHIKGSLKGHVFHDEKELIVEIRKICNEISVPCLQSVFANWTARLHWVCEHDGIYFREK